MELRWALVSFPPLCFFSLFSCGFSSFFSPHLLLFPPVRSPLRHSVWRILHSGGYGLPQVFHGEGPPHWGPLSCVRGVRGDALTRVPQLARSHDCNRANRSIHTSPSRAESVQVDPNAFIVMLNCAIAQTAHFTDAEVALTQGVCAGRPQGEP